MKAKLANVISLLIGLVVCCTLLPKAQAGCSVHDHLCSYHAIGQITTPAIEKQLGEDSSQGQFSESGLYVISAWQDNASNQSADLDLEVLLPEKALNEDPRSNQFLLPTYSDTGPYVIRSVGYPPDGNPFEGIDAEAPRHVGTDQYDITFMNNTARAIHSEDANGANIIRNEPAVRPCKITKNCEFVQIKGNIPSGEYRGAVTNYDYHNLSDPSTPYYILGAYLSPDLEETGVIINRSHTNGAMVGTIEDPDQVSEHYVFDFYNRGFSHAKGANAYDDFTKNFYGKTKYADPYTYTQGIYDITVQNKYRDEWTNAYTNQIGIDGSVDTTNHGTIARRNNVFIGADTSYAYTPEYLNYLAEMEAERQRQISQAEEQAKQAKFKADWARGCRDSDCSVTVDDFETIEENKTYTASQLYNIYGQTLVNSFFQQSENISHIISNYNFFRKPLTQASNNPIKNINSVYEDLPNISEVKNTLEGKRWIDYTLVYEDKVPVSGLNGRVQRFFGIHNIENRELSSDNGTAECADFARLQCKEKLQNFDLTPVGGKSAINIYTGKNPKPDDREVDIKKGLTTIIDNLGNGYPVMVGVDYKPDDGAGNPHNFETDHYITVVGMGSDVESDYFSYYDNFTGRQEKEEKRREIGTDLEKNKFRLYKEGNMYILADKDGDVPYEGNRNPSERVYIITEVRNNE